MAEHLPSAKPLKASREAQGPLRKHSLRSRATELQQHHAHSFQDLMEAALKMNEAPHVSASTSQIRFGTPTLSWTSSMTSLISGFLIVKSRMNNITPELLGEFREAPYEKGIGLMIMEDV